MTSQPLSLQFVLIALNTYAKKHPKLLDMPFKVGDKEVFVVGFQPAKGAFVDFVSPTMRPRKKK